MPSLRGVSGANDEAISFKIPSEIPKPCVIPQLDWGISSQKILKFRHCEALKKPKQSHSKFRLKFRYCGNSVIARL